MGTDGTTPVKAPSIPSTAVQVGTPAVGKHSNNDVENSGGHEGDNTPPTTAPTLTAEQTGNKRGAVTVALPSDAQVGDRVVLEFTPENSEEKVIVTLTKASDNNWTSNNTNVVANPTGNSAEIPANQVKDNSPVKVKIVDLAGNETAGQDVTTAFDEVTLLRDVSLTKAIDTDTVSNATPEKFTITGKAEKDAVVKAYVMYNNEKVEIGSTTVASENGEFTFDTNNIRDGQLKEKLKDFNFSTNSPATAITLEATSTGKAPSAPQTVNATAARKGEKDDHTETTAPENPTITPYVEGFGGAKVVLPTPAQGEALEVEITLTPKGENGASEQAKKVKLAHNGSQWVVEGDNANLITLKQVDGKTVAIVTGDKAPFGGTLPATTTDFAGNKPEQAATQELNKGPTDQTAKDTHSLERTDVPTITAGRAEAVSGVDNDQPNAGDIVAKPGGDNDRMVVKYVDENGQAKEIFVKKDLEQGKWVLDTTQPAEQDKKPAEGDYIIKDDGTVIVKGQKVKDGSEAEAVGYKTVGDQQKASSEPYVDNKDSSGNTLEENQIPTDENGQKRTRTDLAKIITHKDDETPTETDAPTVTKGQNGTLEQGSAKIKPGPDNTEVVVKFQGYAKTVTETTPTTSATGADGQAGATQQTTTKVITSTPVTGATTGDAAQTQTPQNENAVLIAKKENGEWKLYTTTETDYNTKVTGTDGKEHNAPKNLMPAPEDVATIDKTSGEITLKPQAVQDNTQVSATGFNAMKQPTTGKEGISQTVDAGLDAKGIKDKTVYSPEITQTNKGDVMVKPGQDNKEMTVTYTDKNGQTQTIKLEKVPASQGETGTAAYPQDATKWVVKKEGTTITGTDGTTTGDTVGTTTENGETISLPNGVTVDTTTGAVTIPKDATQIGKTVKADAKDDQNNTITTGDYTVQEDMTPDRADPITTGNDGDKATFTPGDDTKEMEFFKKPTNGTTSEDKPNGESIGKVVKKENGQWEWQGKGTNTGDAPQVDPATGKVTFPSGGGSLVGDSNGIVAVATDGKNNKSTPTEPVVPPKKDSSEHAAETPTVKPITEGEQQGGMEVTPGGDNNTLTVRYEKEVKPEEGATGTSDGTSGTEGEKNYETITAVKDPNTNKWSFSGDVPSEIAEIDEDTGKITLKPEAVKDGTGIKVEATDSSGNTIVKENDESTKAPSNPDVVDPNNQPKRPTVEPEPETPAQPPAQPELIDDTTTITPADETPTTFKNTGIGQVQINPGAGVDFISFTVTTKDGGEQNIAFIKDDNGWEKYVMQLGDGNGNDIVDGDEKVIYDNVQTIGNGALTVSNITSDSITNILVGKAGDEFLQPFARPTANREDWVVKGGVTEDKVHSFKVKQNPKDAVPERIDVLSDGGKLEAPTVQPIIDQNGKYSLKITADPSKIHSMSFDLHIPEGGEGDTFYIYQSGGRWVPVVNGDYFHKYVVSATAENPNVFFIRDAEGKPLAINDPTDNPSGENIVSEFIYGSRNNLENTEIDKFHAVADNTWQTESKAIKLSPITITSDTAQEGNAGGAPSTPSTGDNGSGTGSTGTATPTPPPAPSKPVIGEPTAEKDSSKTGGVKVKPGENTDAFRVDYQRPDGTNRTIWFKKNNQTWELDNTKNNQANDVQVSTNGSSGLISLNTSNGEVTFAPHAVKDKTTVTITALEGDIARKQKGIEADAELQPTKPTAQIDSANRGGAIVKVGENTSKFKVTYYDEKKGKQKTLVYAKESNNWALKEVDGQQSSQAPEGVNLTNEGKVTLAPNTVKDNSTVKIESYNMEGFIKGNASVKTTLDVVNYDGVTTGFQNITGRLGYNSWTGIFGIKGNDDVYQDWGNSLSSGLKQLSEGGYGNSRPQSTRQDGDGATYKWSNRNDTVLIHETLGKQNEQSGKNYLLTLDFQQGNDTLVVGNDLGTKYKRDGKDIIRLNMGEGDDLLMVGTDNEYFEEYRNKKTGEIDIFTKDAKNSSQWSSQNMDQTWERLSNQINHRNQAGGGRIENATINMGRGDDTIIVEGITGENFGAIMGSTIDLGDGNNRVVIAPNGAYAYKPGHYFNSPMQARGNIKSSTILGGRDSDFIKAALIEQGANIQLKDGNDHVVVNRFQSSTLDMGAGDELVEIRNYSKDPTTGQTLPGLGTIMWDTQIGAGTRINLGTGNDTFFQGSKHIDYDVQINGGSGIDLYRVGGGSKATTDKIKGFERVELVDNGAIIGIKYSDLKASGLELPMKVMKGTEVKNGDKVKVDLGNNNSDWLADSPAQNLGDQGGSWRNGSTVKEDGRTYNVYTINSDVKHQVWVENGIIVI
ncbi:hypothetical protein Q7402_08900 [Glaesserella parasuis]|nr:hypothetical protein [Glaesserella parasuis]MDP0180451.1 hypothetical protein [Glaesserella parasuis]MDP0182445.1 hypothetical protein [Glaesserella parasuis]MDP0226758.1 hypothetical protein [Glaesserella parasuis]MDP0230997.1 hypothetical protein [Glaesserella parasuis]